MQKDQKYGLEKTDLSVIVKALCSNKKVQQVILFGSRTTGNHRNGSDIDLALKGEGLGLQDILDASLALDDLFLPYKFDVLIYDRVKETQLKNHIDIYGVALNDFSLVE